MPTRVQSTVQRLSANASLQLPLPPVTAAAGDLSGDHPVFDLVPEALAELRTALDRSETHYADVPGIAPLRERVAELLNQQGLTVDAENGLIITHGEQEGRFIAVHTVARLGARVVLPSVVHPGAAKTAAIVYTPVEHVPLDWETMAPDLGALRKSLAGGRAAVYVESPNRLTGKVIDRRTVEAIADAVKAADGLVIWDASLATWVPAETDVTMIGALPGMADRTLTLGTLWSGSGVEGWLAAYLAGPPALFGQARSFKQIIAICTTTPAQWGVLGAMRSGESTHRQRLQALAKVRAEAAARAGAAAMPGETVTVLAVRRPTARKSTAAAGQPMSGEAFGATGIVRFTVTPAGEIVRAFGKPSGTRTARMKAKTKPARRVAKSRSKSKAKATKTRAATTRRRTTKSRTAKTRRGGRR
jgi:aspartate/methionine/tyrosine aminotransferase